MVNLEVRPQNPFTQRLLVELTTLGLKAALEIGANAEDAEATWHGHNANTPGSEASVAFQTLNRNPNGHVLDSLVIPQNHADTPIIQKKMAAAGFTNDAEQR